MLLRELFTEATIPSPKKKLGRTFNHLEDLVFFHGSKGALEALAHLKEINKNSSSVRMKWDGAPQIYWGRDDNGVFVLAGHNGWSRGAKGTSPEEVYDFIANQSGNPKTPEEKQDVKYLPRHLLAYIHYLNLQLLRNLEGMFTQMHCF